MLLTIGLQEQPPFYSKVVLQASCQGAKDTSLQNEADTREGREAKQKRNQMFHNIEEPLHSFNSLTPVSLEKKFVCVYGFAAVAVVYYWP